MKNLVRIIAWTLVAIVIQQSIFLYVENIYLDTDMTIKAEKVEEKDENKNKNIEEITINNGINDVCLSDNGRFVAYMRDNKLTVLDSYDNSEKEFLPDNKGEIVFYEWLTNENSMIVIQKVQKNRETYFEPISYNAKKGETKGLTDFNFNEVKININSAKDKVENVIFSTATSSLYIKIKKSNGKSDLYYANIMNQLDLVRKNKDIGNIVVPPTTTNCVMEMGDYVTVLNSPDNIEIPNAKITKILGTDINDNVYFGEQVDGKITKIHYSILNEEKHKWTTFTLSKSLPKEDIKVDYSGKIYVNDSSDNTVTEITGGNSVKYEGDFVQIYSNGVISRVNNKLIKNEIKDNRLIKNKN